MKINIVPLRKEVLKRINQNIDVKIFKKKIDQNNIKKIAEKYQIICDGTDNFKTRFLVNDYCLKKRKIFHIEMGCAALESIVLVYFFVIVCYDLLDQQILFLTT